MVNLLISKLKICYRDFRHNLLVCNPSDELNFLSLETFKVSNSYVVYYFAGKTFAGHNTL